MGRHGLNYYCNDQRESPKRTISTGGGCGSLQMVSELDTERCVSLLVVPVDTRQCASKNAGPQRGVDLGAVHIDWRNKRVPARTLGPEEGWIVMSHIGWRGEQITIYKRVETFSYHTRFKPLRGSPKENIC